MNLKNIDVVLIMSLTSNGIEYHWKGAGIYGNGYDEIGVIRNGMNKPTEAQLMNSITSDNIKQFPSLVDWDSLTHSLTVTATDTTITAGATTTIDSVSANDCIYALFDDDDFDSADDLLAGNTLEFSDSETGTYKFVFIDTVTFETGQIVIIVE